MRSHLQTSMHTRLQSPPAASQQPVLLGSRAQGPSPYQCQRQTSLQVHSLSAQSMCLSSRHTPPQLLSGLRVSLLSQGPFPSCTCCQLTSSVSAAQQSICQQFAHPRHPCTVYLCHLLSVCLQLDGCNMHAMCRHNLHFQCVLTHIIYHAPGPSGSMTPPASSLAAPSTPRTQPQPSTSAAAALRNQPATTSQVGLVFLLLVCVYIQCASKCHAVCIHVNVLSAFFDTTNITYWHLSSRWAWNASISIGDPPFDEAQHQQVKPECNVIYQTKLLIPLVPEELLAAAVTCILY